MTSTKMALAAVTADGSILLASYDNYSTIGLFLSLRASSLSLQAAHKFTVLTVWKNIIF